MGMRSLSSVGLPPARSTPVLWDALVSDLAVPVAIIDADGVIRFANDVFARLVSENDPRSVLGRSLEQFLPPAMAEERIQVTRSVALSGKPVQLKTIWRGVRNRVFFRPLPARIAGKRAVLITMRQEHAGEPEAPGARVVHARHVDEGPLASLSPRERTVLSLIGAGMSTAQMAAELGRSAKTIENQRYSLARKLGAKNRVELARIALSSGLSAPATGHPSSNGRSRSSGRQRQRAGR